MKALLSIALLAIGLVPAFGEDLDREEKALREFDKALPQILENFNHEMPCQEFAALYAHYDYDGDGFPEMVVSNNDTTRTVFYKIKDGFPRRISADFTGNENWNWIPYYYSNRDYNYDDITLKHRPVFLQHIDIAKNRFSTTSEVCEPFTKNPASSYNRMFFKPHINVAKLVGTKATGKEVVHTFALKDASALKKMFRGYSSYQATPIIVPEAFLNTHNILQYSRWLNGEKEVKASADVIKLISDYYGGRRIIASKWIATCEINERSFYMVLFEPKDDMGLSAMVCIAEGNVESVHNDWIALNKDDNTMTEWGSMYDAEDVFFHAPQIMAMVACEAGLELYVRWNSYEGIHYAIWREMSSQWVAIQDDYEYLMAY